jgi:hypothetical protein
MKRLSKRGIGGLLKPFLFLLLTAAVALAVTAPANAVGVGASPSVVNLGTIGRGGSATQDFRIYNTDNSTPLNYTVAVVGANAVSVTPSSGALNPLTNTTVTVQANVNNSAKDGNYSGLLVVNSTASGRTGQAVILPALAVTVKYLVNGTAPTPQSTTTIPLVPLVAAGIIVVVIAALYVGIRRLR